METRIILIDEEDRNFMCSLFGPLDTEMPVPNNFSLSNPLEPYQPSPEIQLEKPKLSVRLGKGQRETRVSSDHGFLILSGSCSRQQYPSSFAVMQTSFARWRK
jgi:hypothetical protein